MIDVHTHLIPNVDDGSKSLQTSIEMVKQEIAQGVDIAICTPHHMKNKYEKSIDEIERNFNLLVEEVKRLNLPIKLYLGQEIYYTKKEPILDLLDSKQIVPLHTSNIVLLEFSYINKVDDLEEIVYEFSLRGYQVMIAHVERYSWMKEATIEAIKKYGAYIQVNASSLVKGSSMKERMYVKRLIKHDLVDCIASDIHSFRPTCMNEAYQKVKNKQLFHFPFVEKVPVQ